MATTFHFDDTTGAVFTGTASTSLIGGTLPNVTGGTTEVREQYGINVVASYLNNTGAARNIDFDLTIAGDLAHRFTLYTVPANASERDLVVRYVLTATATDECLIVGTANLSATGTGQDTRVTTTVAVAPFDTTNDQDIDIKATLSSVSNVTTHKLTPVDITIDKLLYGGGTGSGEDFELPADVIRSYVLSGDEYVRPTGGFFPNPDRYYGAVEPNGVNSPATLKTYDEWIDTSGA
jgi:hypothetical protein